MTARKWTVDMMRREEYDILREIFDEFRQEEAQLCARIDANSRFIREERTHLKAFSESEPDGFRYFSPRSAENIHKEEIKYIEKEISAREEQNKKLKKRKTILAGRIGGLRNILNSAEALPGAENASGEVPSQEAFPRACSEPDREKITMLTNRETQILVRIAKGMLNKEIADSLNISERTVKNHISSIFRKINVWDRTQAAVFAIRNGIAEPDQDAPCPQNS